MLIEELCAKVGMAKITVHKALPELDYLTSYNHNSRFYTLRRFCDFNQNGIYKRRGVLFTEHKTLERLLIRLVEQADEGLTAGELDRVAEVRTTDSLRRLAQRGQLRRIRHGRDYVYFTARSARQAERQVRKHFRDQKLVVDVKDEDTEKLKELRQEIVVLLEIIRRQPKTQVELEQWVARDFPNVARGLGRTICQKYALDLKKKSNELDLFELVVRVSKQLQRLLSSPVVLHLYPEEERCPICYKPLSYYRTSVSRSFSTLRYGSISFREDQYHCAEHHCAEDGSPVLYGSSFLRKLLKPGFNVGYDVIVEIGRLRFIECRQVTEVVSELSQHDIKIGTSSVSRYSDFFLAAIECLHYSKLHKLRILIRQKGGYALNIDCSRENKSDTVFVCIDSVTDIVLLSEKIPSENEEHVKPQLRTLKRHLGNPVVIMKDMSVALQNSVSAVFPNVPSRVCQFHFLKDIGKDLMQDLNVALGHSLSELKINSELAALKRELEHALSTQQVESAFDILEHSAITDLSMLELKSTQELITLRLIVWILDYSSDDSGLGFPFDRPRLTYCRRLNIVRLRLNHLVRQQARTFHQCQYLVRLHEILSRVQDNSIRHCVKRMRVVARHFDHLRTVLHFEISQATPLADTLSIESLPQVKRYNADLKAYAQSLTNKLENKTLSDSERVILTHMVKFQHSLPIPQQLIEIFDLRLKPLQQTNNIQEGLFRGVKRIERRTSGKKDISREFNNHGPYLPLMKNLTNDDYIQTVIGSIQDLPLRLAELNQDEIAHYSEKLYEARRGKFHDILKQLDPAKLLPAHP